MKADRKEQPVTWVKPLSNDRSVISKNTTDEYEKYNRAGPDSAKKEKGSCDVN